MPTVSQASDGEVTVLPPPPPPVTGGWLVTPAVAMG
jgi:hypothetical protein